MLSIEEKNEGIRQSIPNDDLTPIGRKVKILRISLNLTQEDFANLLLVKRGLIIKLETLRDLESITDNIAFRLYYLVQKIIEDANNQDYIKILASDIKKDIDIILKNRTNQL